MVTKIRRLNNIDQVIAHGESLNSIAVSRLDDMNRSRRTVVITVRVPAELPELLRQIAAMRNLTPSIIVREALQQYLKGLGDEDSVL